MNRSTNSLFFLGVLLAILVCTAYAPVAGQSVYSTKFEDPPFVAGQPLVGQDGWIAPGILSPDAAVISTDQPRQGKQSVRVLGADLDEQQAIIDLTDGYYAAAGSYRKTVDFDTEGIVRVQISANVRVDGPTTPLGTNFFSASIAARALLDDGDTAGVGQIDISSDGHVYAQDGNHNVPVFLKSAPITLGEWHELAIVDDFGAQTFTLYVDGKSLGTYLFPTVDPDTNQLLVYTTTLRRGSLLAQTAPETGSMRKADYTAHHDNFSISVVGKGHK
jgi:hypothetical protein